MKKIYLLLLAFAWAPFLMAQDCTPDTTVSTMQVVDPLPFDAEAVPGGGIYTYACVDDSYEFVFNFAVPDVFTTESFPSGIPLEQIAVATEDGVDGLPASMDYTCNPPNCVFEKNTFGCLILSGTPTAGEEGTYDIGVSATIRALVNGFPLDIPLSFPDPSVFPGSYTLEVRSAGCVQQVNVAEIRELDGEGISVLDGETVAIQGVVYGVDLQGNDNIQFTVIDRFGDGISVFSEDNFGYTVTEGDRIALEGTVSSFRGLNQISPTSLSVISQNNELVEPTVVTALNEDTESQLIQIEGVTLVDASQWMTDGSSFNIDVTDGTNTYAMRIDSDTDIAGTAAPEQTFNLTGIGGQFDQSSPFTEGYQILPRYIADIDFNVSTIRIDPSLAQEVKVFPNPTAQTLFVNTTEQFDFIRISNLLGQEMTTITKPNLVNQIDLSAWANGIYALTVIRDGRSYTTLVEKI